MIKTDDYHIKKLLKIGEKYFAKAQPNPPVIAAVVKNNKWISYAAHTKVGSPHAEVLALTKAGNLAKGATLYVSLEPCTHYGRTPPCVEFIKKMGINRVVYAASDPNPLVKENPAHLYFEQHQISCSPGVLENQAKYLHRIYFTNMILKRPFIFTKIAASIDGKIALSNGESCYLTGEKTRKWVHKLRECLGFIMVGIGTILTDNPKLTVRYKSRAKHPGIILLDSKGKLPSDSDFIHCTKRPILCFTSKNKSFHKQKFPSHVKFIQTPECHSGLNLEWILKACFKMNICSIMCEGGQKLFTSLFEQNLIDELACCIAPKIIGEKNAPSIFSSNIEKNINKLQRYNLDFIEKFDNDILLRYSPNFACYKSQ